MDIRRSYNRIENACNHGFHFVFVIRLLTAKNCGTEACPTAEGIQHESLDYFSLEKVIMFYVLQC